MHENSIIVTTTHLVLGMRDESSKYRICKYQHSPTISNNWCRYTDNNGEVYSLALDTSSTYVFAGGYYDTGTNNDKIALLMRIGFGAGSGVIFFGWLQPGADINYYYVNILEYYENSGSKYLIAILEKISSGGGIGVSKISLDSSFNYASSTNIRF